jgi:DNA-binding MarR family transcriptional regulator
MVEKGFAEYLPNPARRRAKLLALTAAGRSAIARITPGHRAFAGRLARQLGPAEFERALHALEQLSAALEALEE